MPILTLAIPQSEPVTDKKRSEVRRLLVKIALDCWGSGTYEFPKLKDQPHEAGLLRLDIKKATAELDWKPVLDSSKAIALTIEWYKAFQNGKDITDEQIRDYFQL